MILKGTSHRSSWETKAIIIIQAWEDAFNESCTELEAIYLDADVQKAKI